MEETGIPTQILSVHRLLYTTCGYNTAVGMCPVWHGVIAENQMYFRRDEISIVIYVN